MRTTHHGLIAGGRALKRFAKEFDKAVQEGMTSKTADLFLEDVGRETPKGKTGNLRRSWTKQKATSRRRGRYVVGSRFREAPYGNVIFPGRRRSKKDGRMIGSKQTGRGHIVRRVQKRFRSRFANARDTTVGRLFR